MAGSALDVDGRRRCWWATGDDLYRAYHDLEWGFPMDEDRRLFEKLSLEGFQAGLSWLTILRKRESFREAFAGFEIARVAAMGPDDVERLLGDASIVRHRGKIEATLRNARRAEELVEEFGSLAAFVWSFEPPDHQAPVDEPPITIPEATTLSRELKRRGWSFVGPTIAYAFMQAMGLVNDHLVSCELRGAVEAARGGFVRPA